MSARRILPPLLATLTLAAAAPLAAQEPTPEDAQVFLKNMILNQNMGIARNGSVDIDQAVFKDECTLVLAGQSRFFIVVIDFKKATLDPDKSMVPDMLLIERGVTIYRAGHLLQQEDSSSLDLHFYSLGLEPRIYNAMNTLHAHCYGGDPYKY